MEKSSEKLTDINQIGEFGLIDLITKDFEIVNDSTELSIGDDAAILNYKNQKTIVSTDMLVERCTL
jgi:Thiamine monophosphate kinase